MTKGFSPSPDLAAKQPQPETVPATQLRPRLKPARVVYVVSDLSVGGAEMMLYRLLAETDRARFDPTVVTLMEGGALRARVEALGVEVHTLGVNPNWPTPLDLSRLVRLTRRLRPDLFVGWMYHGCLAAQLAAFFSTRPTPVLWSLHYSVSSLAGEKRLTAATVRACALLSAMPARIVFVSRDGRSKHGPLGFKTANSCVVPNGIDTNTFAPSPEARASVRAELGLPDDAFVVGTVGRFHPAKDHANFLRAAALLSAKRSETHFLLAGRGVDGDNTELRRLVEELGLARRTHMLGERHDIPRLTAALDIFSLSSSCESFPTVVGEAMACGVPCAVTDVGDAALIVGDTGRVVPQRDARALAGAWSALIDLGNEGRAALGRAAAARVRELFPIGSMARSYESLYETALHARTPAARRTRGIDVARAYKFQMTDAGQPESYGD
jgi:glycosyltransferase involved in cell wall biosynthesis